MRDIWTAVGEDGFIRGGLLYIPVYIIYYLSYCFKSSKTYFLDGGCREQSLLQLNTGMYLTWGKPATSDLV